ncbi:MAG: type II toxin-antitoxin system HicB family antitoxin [Verrucomicrobiota bacterium]
MNVEIEREEDGRWIAEIPEIPGALVYAESRRDAIDRVETLALRAVADRLEHGERVPALDELFAVPA